MGVFARACVCACVMFHVCLCVCLQSHLESDVQKAKVDCLRVSNTLEEYMLSFERKKVQDYKV